jgi:predicted type IV restriction endonuclease
MQTPLVPDSVLRLVERFDRNRDAYIADGINETQLRREFIDPFFSCLGWDIENKQGCAPD